MPPTPLVTSPPVLPEPPPPAETPPLLAVPALLSPPSVALPAVEAPALGDALPPVDAPLVAGGLPALGLVLPLVLVVPLLLLLEPPEPPLLPLSQAALRAMPSARTETKVVIRAEFDTRRMLPPLARAGSRGPGELVLTATRKQYVPSGMNLLSNFRGNGVRGGSFGDTLQHDDVETGRFMAFGRRFELRSRLELGLGKLLVGGTPGVDRGQRW